MNNLPYTTCNYRLHFILQPLILVFKLKLLREMYEICDNIALKINNAYGFILLMSLTLYFIAMCAHLKIVYSTFGIQNDVIDCVVDTMWTCFYFGKFIYIINACQSYATEVNLQNTNSPIFFSFVSLIKLIPLYIPSFINDNDNGNREIACKDTIVLERTTKHSRFYITHSHTLWHTYDTHEIRPITRHSLSINSVNIYIYKNKYVSNRESVPVECYTNIEWTPIIICLSKRLV